jgi:hypothetical protein
MLSYKKIPRRIKRTLQFVFSPYYCNDSTIGPSIFANRFYIFSKKNFPYPNKDVYLVSPEQNSQNLLPSSEIRTTWQLLQMPV